MSNEIKTLNGIMNLDDSNEVMPFTHHKEARNGVFKGSAPEMHFTAIRGNVKVNNTSISFNDCKLSGSALFTPNCTIVGTAVYIPKCDLAGNAILQVNFSITATCSLNDGTIVINGITGGGGTYEIGTQAYSSEANALAATTFTTANTLTFNNMPDGTFWFVVRDKNNTSNKIAKSVAVACNGTSTECRNSVSVVISSAPTQVFYEDCCGVSKNVLYNTAGTYTITDCIKGGSLSSPDAGFASFTYSVTTCICPPPDPTANWVDKNYNVCIDCVSYDVFRDENQFSLTYLKYKVNDVIGTTTAPIESACNTDANYSENVGTYYSCSAGTVSSNTVYKNTNTCFTGNQYKAGTITYTTDPSNISPSTDPILTDQGYYTCYNCVNRLVYKNTNECSPYYGYYYVNGDRLTTSQPPAGNCPTVANWVDLNFQTCYGCQNLWVYQDQSNCTSTSYKYRIGGEGGLVVDERPSNVLCDDIPNWVLTGYNTCVSCQNYPVYKDTKGCSPSYNKYRVNNVIVGYDEPTRGNCNTTADWQNEGPRVCIDCYSKQKQRDMNFCSLSYNTTQYVDSVYGIDPCYYGADYTVYEGIYHYCSAGTVYQVPVYSNSNVCFTGMATAQYRADFGGGNYIYYGTGSNPVNAYPNTSPIWYTLPVETDYYCNGPDGMVVYYKQQDINQCSASAGSYQMGGQYGIVAGYCGYNPTTCTSYEVVNYDSNYDLQVDYVACGGSATTEYVGGGMTMTICAEAGTVSISGNGSFTEVGTCSV